MKDFSELLNIYKSKHSSGMPVAIYKVDTMLVSAICDYDFNEQYKDVYDICQDTLAYTESDIDISAYCKNPDNIQDIIIIIEPYINADTYKVIFCDSCFDGILPHYSILIDAEGIQHNNYQPTGDKLLCEIRPEFK